MHPRRALRLIGALACLATAGCTTLREIPRSDFGARPERRNVRVVTRDSLEYEFDYARFESDSVVGYRRRDVEGPFDDYAVLRLALEEVATMAARGVDWRRTLLVGGGIAAGGVAAGLATRAIVDGRSSTSGGGKNPGGVE